MMFGGQLSYKSLGVFIDVDVLAELAISKIKVEQKLQYFAHMELKLPK
jgi:hypothetical protein